MKPKYPIFSQSWHIFNTNFKHVVLSRLDELMSLYYMIEKLEMSNFHHSLNRDQIPFVAPDMS